MATPDEPLPTASDEEFEEVSDDLIVEPGATLPGAVQAPDSEPSATISRVEKAPAGKLRSPSPPAEARPARVASPTPAKPASRRSPPPPAEPVQPRLDEASTRVVVVPRETAPRRSLVPTALLFLLLGLGGGFFAGRLWERQERGAAPPATPPAPPVAEQPGEPAERPAVPKPAPKPVKATRPARTTRTAPAAPAGKGWMELTAPAQADVYLDGRRVGRGSMRIPVAAGKHRIEVRLGKSRVAETFVSEPGMTWTYEVTPSK